MELKINDRVKVKNFDNLPEDRRNRNWGKVGGKTGVVLDKLYSEAEQAYIYKLMLDGATAPSSIDFTDDMLEKVAGGGTISVLVTVEENLVIVRLYQGDKEIRCNHGHIFHEGVAGVAQAVSYASKRLSLSFEENQNIMGRRHNGN